MIIDEIKKANIQAIKDKNKNARTIYSIIMNKHLLASVDARTSGNSVTDADMVRIISKTIKELEEEISGFEKANRPEQVKELNDQKSVISKYLPKMMSDDEIRTEISKLEEKSIPSIMKHFKANFMGKCDMGTVSKIAKEFI